MSLEVKIEIRSTVKKKANCFADGITHDFIVFVQGHNGNHIEHFIKEIVFYLPFNSNSKQVRRKPPYFIQGSTQASFRLPIDLFFHTTINLFKMSISYYLLVPDKPLENAVCVKTLTFLNTPQDFKERLLLGGAEEVHHLMNSDAVATHSTCKSEPVEIIENQEVVDFKDTSEKSSEQILCKIEPTEELNELKQKAETNEAKISTLKSDVQLLMSEILQHKKKVNEVTGKMKRQETSAILSSSFDSESFKSSLSLENEPSTNILSAEKGRTVMNKSINKDLYKNLNEGSGQQYAKDKQNKLQEALIEDRDADHTILNPEKTKTNIEKLSTENDCLQLRDCNYEKDEIQKFSSNQKDTELAVLSCSERDVDSSNTKTITIKKDELQMSLLKRKNIESVDSNYQERDSVVSNFIHLENPSLNRKRARFLPIPEDRKEHCRANTSVQQHDLCLIPCVTSLDIPESEKHSTGAEQVCLPTKGSLNTITAPCIAANEQFGKFTQNKCFKNPKSETNPQFTNAIQNIVKYINKRPISDSDFKSYVHSLFQFLVNPVNSPNISTLIFLVINHLCFTRRNYLKDFKKDQANCIFLPSSESCIVTTLFEIEKKSETYSQLKLIKNMLSTIHEFVRTWKKKYNIHGVASLCRVFTEICKRKKDLLSPLSLCADILKMRHIYAPYLIASIVGVWKEPFMVPSDNSDETMILIGAISLGVQNRTEDANCRGRYYLKDLILEYFGFPSLPGVNIAENLLKDKIISNCTQNSHEKSWMLTSSLVILATCKPWQWTRKHLIDDFILPNLSRFSSWEPHEKAFGLFCELYVDVYLLHPNIPNEESLIKYFEQASDKGIGFVKEWATVSLMKYLISKRRPIPSNFSEWLEKNKDLTLRMKAALLLIVIPCLVVADVQCPDNKITCPEDKRCCKLEGRYTCCDSDDTNFSEIKTKVRAGMDIMNFPSYPNVSGRVIQASSLAICSRENCYGECCSSTACCPYIAADCCTETTCCPSLHRCCPDERCCPMGQICCSDFCCSIGQQCCPTGCCGLFDKCCGTGCCPSGTQCCGSWCCLDAQRCGASKNECHDVGNINTPSFLSLLLLIGFIVVSHRL
ncbi:Protein AF-9 like protein [Argiope bruennichi]|uniref:Protein AF-9 like protein n=1 Tax=Argiope bruennichi TaxID=94029 RepID=A0A8T0FX90_ARGBR|nr:Protein AF-9 like protein [Argiope bruennichi]